MLAQHPAELIDGGFEDPRILINAAKQNYRFSIYSVVFSCKMLSLAAIICPRREGFFWDFDCFLEGNESPYLPGHFKQLAIDKLTEGTSDQETYILSRLFRTLRSMNETDRQLFLRFAQRVAGRNEMPSG